MRLIIINSSVRSTGRDLATWEKEEAEAETRSCRREGREGREGKVELC